MKKLVCFFMLLVLFAGSSCAIYQLKLPEDIPPVIKLETHDKKTGKLQGMEEIRISRVNGGGEELLAIESLAWVNVKNEKYDQAARTLYNINNDLITVRSQKIDAVLDKKGLFLSNIDFDWTKKQASSVFKDLKKNEERTEKVELNNNSILVCDLSFYITSMISSGKKNGTANVILPGGKVLKSNIEVDYEPEQITISGRQIRSYRAKTTFDLGMLSIFSPTLQFWFMADAPYFFLRYMGPGSSPGSSDIIQEVVNL